MTNGFIHFMQERLNHFKKMIPLSMTFFFYLFGWGLISPIFNIRINQITNSLFLSGIIFSLLGFVGIFFNPSVGMWADRINPKKLLQGSLIAYSIIFIMYANINSFTSLFITRFLHSIACSVLWISGWTLVRRQTKGRYAQEELSSWSTIQNIAYVIAPIIGGLIISILNWPIVFYLASISTLISFTYLTIKVQSPNKKNNGVVKTFKQELKAFFKNRSSATRLVLLTGTLFFISSAFSSFLPLTLINSGNTIEEISIILGLAATTPYIIFPILIGVLADKYGRKTPTLFGLIFITLGLILFTNATNFTQFLFHTFIIYTGVVFIDMSTNAELNDLLPTNKAGSFTGIFETIKNFGLMLGPLIIGAVSASTSINYSFIILAIISISSTLILKGFKEF